ncbi:MAG: hypothetical protein V1743_03420 [Nanoarchaeota archaeon]
MAPGRIRPSYKQRCIVCKKNMVIISSFRQQPVCEECLLRDINKPITNPVFKKMFDIDKEFYMKYSFLRNIKDQYLRYGKLSEKQIEIFKKVVADAEKKKKEAKEKS